MADDFDSTFDESLLDEIGPWSERKHGIVQDYSTVYSILANAQKRIERFSHDYIDGYASAGYSKRKNTSDIVKGTALNSLAIQPPFDDYTFVELNAKKAEMLRGLVRQHPNVAVLNADANVVLPKDIFPRYAFSNFRRAFCLLDPYTHKALRWETIAAAGRTGAIDLLLHFPTMPMNRGALHRDGHVEPEEAAFLTDFWGDEAAWRDAAYPEGHGLFENLPREKASDLQFATAFCERLVNVGGFLGTSTPIPMKNSRGATMYYLIFALPHATAIKAAKSVARYFIQNPTAVHRTTAAGMAWLDAG